LAGSIPTLAYKDSSDAAMTYTSHSSLDQTRRKIIATAFPEVATAKGCFSVIAKKGDAVKEFIVTVGDGDAATLLEGSCKITYEDLSPSECIEYSFTEAPDDWSMTQLSQLALETYRGMKFEAWKHMLETPSCEAAFRRLLQIGMITQLFDPEVFPTAEAHKAKYQVTDERSGKLIQLPHPVSGLRIWDVQAQAYKRIETQLTGAPGAAEAPKWWDEFVQELNAKHGAEYIAGLVEVK